jgi:hypothetical protein
LRLLAEVVRRRKLSSILIELWLSDSEGMSQIPNVDHDEPASVTHHERHREGAVMPSGRQLPDQDARFAL